jgi:hypothetical protein
MRKTVDNPSNQCCLKQQIGQANKKPQERGDNKDVPILVVAWPKPNVITNRYTPRKHTDNDPPTLRRQVQQGKVEKATEIREHNGVRISQKDRWKLLLKCSFIELKSIG